MLILKYIYSTLEGVLFFYFAYTAFYNLLLSISAHFISKFQKSQKTFDNYFCVLIPAYKEDNVILETTQLALKQNYPDNKFDIVVIADSLSENTIKNLVKTSVKVIEVSFEKSTKVKALNAAFNSLKSNYDACVILDADNTMDEEFLVEANALLNAGYLSIQGQRLPKTSNSTIAFLDGLSEAINTNIFRKGSFNLGLSSSISGSGYVANYKVLKGIIATMDSVSGFDKELEIKFLEKGVKTIYAGKLKVYDEKVANQKDFKNQRRRWIYSQYFYLSKYFKVSIKALFSLKIALLNSSFLRYAQLPRFLNMVLLFFCGAIFTGINAMLNQSVLPWWMIVLLYFLSIILAIPRRFYNKQFMGALLQLPRTFITMFGLLFKLKGTNEMFIHTPHGKKDSQ